MVRRRCLGNHPAHTTLRESPLHESVYGFLRVAPPAMTPAGLVAYLHRPVSRGPPFEPPSADQFSTGTQDPVPRKPSNARRVLLELLQECGQHLPKGG